MEQWPCAITELKTSHYANRQAFFAERGLSQHCGSLNPMAEPDTAATWSGPYWVPASATEP